MGAKVFLAQSTRDLLPGLVERLRVPQADPFAPEILVVPTAGARDWLIEHLAHELDTGDGGILANVEFWFPNEFDLHAIGIVRESDGPWSKANLRWALLGLLTDAPESVPGFAGSRRPLGVAERIAHLFDQYGVYRPEMQASWAVSTAAKDPERPLAADKVWQFDLWRVAREQLGESPAERFIGARKHLSADDVRAAVRGRISVFGLDVFSPAKVSLLAAMADHLDVEIHAVFPSLSRVDAIRGVDLGDRLRRDHDLTALVSNPLARSWARAGLETMALLTHELPRAEIRSGDHPNSVLGRLQRSIADDLDLPAPADGDDALDGGDGSIQIHRCHGATRQVEVLRDALLHRLVDDPTLHPRDIIVICPDIETYGPLLEPIMGARFTSIEADGVERHMQLPLAIIDKSTATATPVAETIGALFDAVADRLSIGTVLEVLAQEPVRRRFAIADDDLATIDHWLNEIGVHWGIDGQFRSGWGYPAEVDAGTWRGALDRLATGIVLQSPEPREAPTGVVPFDDLSGSSIELIGRLAEFLDALETFTRDCRDPHTAAEWAETMAVAIPAFIAVPASDSNQIADALDVVEQLRRHAEVTHGARLGANEIATLFADGLDGVRARSRVWGDVVRVASLSRLRGVSARIVAILGFDDRAFATGRGAGDDILLDEPRLAERDFHAEERLGLLGLLASASDAVIITCNGHDVTNNKPVPMAVPLEELTDAIAAVIAAGPPSASPSPVLVQHSRQAADPVNFGRPGSEPAKNVGAIVEGAWSFDPAAALLTRSVHSAGGADDDLEWPVFGWDPRFDEEPITIAQLHTALRRPAQLYIRERLRVRLPGDDRSAEDSVMLWPDSLQQHQLGSQVIEAKRSGRDDGELRRLRALMGDVPIGAVADPMWKEIEASADVLLGVGGVDYTPGTPMAIDLEVDGVRIVDSVDVRNGQLVTVTQSMSSARHRTRPWLELAAVTLTDPDTAFEAVVISREDSKRGLHAEWMSIRGDTPAERAVNARQVLEHAIAMRRLALRAVIPLFERSSWIVDGSRSDLGNAVERDVSEMSARLLFGEIEAWMLLDPRMEGNDIRPIDVGIGSRGTRFQRYAQQLVVTFDDTTSLLGIKGVKAPITRDKAIPSAAQRALADELDAAHREAAKATKAAAKKTTKKASPKSAPVADGVGSEGGE